MTSPQKAWSDLQTSSPTVGWISAALVAPLSGATALAWSTGILLTPMREGAHSPFMLNLTTTFALSYVAIAMLALAMAALLPIYERPRDWRRSWVVAASSATPMLLGGALLFHPLFLMLMVVAVPYAAYLVYLGGQHLLGVAPGDAAEFTAVSMLVAAAASMVLGAVIAAAGII